MKKQPILITGAHRSSTTWVGTVMGRSEEVCYIFEPFNKHFGPGNCRRVFEHWFPYVTTQNEDKYLQCIRDLVEFRFPVFKELFAVRSKWQLRNYMENLYNFRQAKEKKQRALFKDPIAFFSTPWLVERFDFQVLVLVRHPAAFAGSLKRLKWRFPFSDFLEQPLLMEGPLAPYRRDIEIYAKYPPGIIKQAVLLWNIIYGTARQYRYQYKDWIFARHEDISSTPVHTFGSLFKQLNLEFTPEIENYIALTTDGAKSDEIPANKATVLKRNSKENIKSWKRRLQPGEIKEIREATEEIASTFYPEKGWW